MLLADPGSGMVLQYIAATSLLTAISVGIGLSFLLKSYESVKKNSGILRGMYSRRLNVLLNSIGKILEARSEINSELVNYLIKETTEPSFKESTADFISTILDRTAEIFGEETGFVCSCSIKILTPNPIGQKEPWFITHARDSISSQIRRRDDASRESYPITAHTPFHQLLSDLNNRGFYCNNDLRFEVAEGRYSNGNENWRRYYNATAIVTIEDPATTRGEDVIGFLCVDNKFGSFEPENCYYILSLIASELYFALYTVSLLDTIGQQDLLASDR
jgi:hypothetical protein